MNLLKQFQDLIGKETLGIATLEQERAPNYWQAQTEAGAIIYINGEGKAGDKIFYDWHTLKIIGRAPKINFTDIPL